ncbi:hypothetical protein ACRQ5Q_33070 [Bradyrhizobium sp. PMVTL-01]|uniref:hypothetical protein n=1 Tax=Bradyrhizobium sp. PMVTL-01 TaxID=3434999 RepID=UPI003F71EBC7
MLREINVEPLLCWATARQVGTVCRSRRTQIARDVAGCNPKSGPRLRYHLHCNAGRALQPQDCESWTLTDFPVQAAHCPLMRSEISLFCLRTSAAAEAGIRSRFSCILASAVGALPARFPAEFPVTREWADRAAGAAPEDLPKYHCQRIVLRWDERCRLIVGRSRIRLGGSLTGLGGSLIDGMLFEVVG